MWNGISHGVQTLQSWAGCLSNPYSQSFKESEVTHSNTDRLPGNQGRVGRGTKIHTCNQYLLTLIFRKMKY